MPKYELTIHMDSHPLEFNAAKLNPPQGEIQGARWLDANTVVITTKNIPFKTAQAMADLARGFTAVQEIEVKEIKG